MMTFNPLCRLDRRLALSYGPLLTLFDLCNIIRKLTVSVIVADQEANWLSRTLNRVGRGEKLENIQGFKWKNKGSMVLIGDQQVSRSFFCASLHLLDTYLL
jgi:hypothetical protein